MKNRVWRKMSLLVLLGACTLPLFAQWKPVEKGLKTRWASEVHPENVLSEYPRPQMVREDWKNLNGIWKYAIRRKGEAMPVAFDGDILVPFAIESSLSGVQKKVGKNHELWYEREFSVPKQWKNKEVLLHFGAVDWRTSIYMNGILIKTHEGGYTPFSVNITPFLKRGKQRLTVSVFDPTSDGYQPRGKQDTHPHAIWYTSVTGIWQTVWIEPVQKQHITRVTTIPDVDTSVLNVKVETEQHEGWVAQVELWQGNQRVAFGQGVPNARMRLAVESPRLWSPESPFLYDLKVILQRQGKVVDSVKSYAAFRKIDRKRDEKGEWRMYLNNQPYFQMGLLDQGWWPDGLYTAPTDEALRFDIEKTKAWGFNMIRKHVKVEPARWYYHCDRLGVLVWQDMPSGDMNNKWEYDTIGQGTDSPRSEASKANYYAEWKEIMLLCMSHPSVVVWVPFNEAWGQFDTEKVSEWTAQQDSSRLVNAASGGNFRNCGDILDVHHYPEPHLNVKDNLHVTVLGEYGGIGMPVKGHLWSEKKNWGYVKYDSKEKVTATYVAYAQQLKTLIDYGFSSAVYTQTTDVEGEVNGLMTYDRAVVKVNEKKIKAVNTAVINALK